MRCTLDSMFKVGFGVDLNCLEGSSKQGSAFIKAFDDSNALVYWRYVDPLWKLKKFLNVGSEASLKKNVKLIDDFVNDLIRTKRKQLAVQQDSVSAKTILLFLQVVSFGNIQLVLVPSLTFQAFERTNLGI